jgi:hypothetical protein
MCLEKRDMADDVPKRMETFSFGRAWIDEELGIMRLTFQAKCEIALKHAKEQVAVMQRLTQGVPVPCLVDMRDIRRAERDARDYYAGAETAKAATACAMVIGASGVGTAIGNFMIAIYGKKMMMPIKLFTNEQSAIAWLQTFRTDSSRTPSDRESDRKVS